MVLRTCSFLENESFFTSVKTSSSFSQILLLFRQTSTGLTNKESGVKESNESIGNVTKAT